ncbi:MAG: transcription termination factor Rho [Dehalococcoidales bacterium]|nr:transcription termination factor Rho [Dehalococcoidales bacterium]MDP7110207.1 transcription termination factor Rho [Dehalococcoidales bacterium]MDP7310241.1 transcription termination factor Rho [Dehalococcoidales bacterium]MDP7409233.1 transcription termination factor Rho [Dehalococcoidales bacterium]MDP7675567.1 transcription termination factor Rho [Dehalococcoidales bacterium]
MEISQLENKTVEELAELAKEMGVTNHATLDKQDIIMRLLQASAEQEGDTFCSGILETMTDGYGFLRTNTLLPSSGDVYVSQSQVRRFGLRNGDMVAGRGRSARAGEKYFSLLRVEAVNDLNPELARSRPRFGQLTPTFPDKLINLEIPANDLSGRVLNLVAPIGRGQRGLIVSPPKAGKTMLMQSIANCAATNYNDIHIMVCLIGERPEEVTDMRRSLLKGEVVAATFDEPVENHTRVAELALERAKHMVESGKDVLILLDGITRLTRSYNLAMPSSGRTLSGGIDPAALYPAKHFFGAARNTEEGGSLTIIATCLVDTGSRMDDLIYEEFKGTGNMEIHLDRRLAERRIFPAINIERSGTRREELLLGTETLKQAWLLRRMVSMISSDSPSYAEAAERVLDRLRKTKSNADFLANLNNNKEA